MKQAKILITSPVLRENSVPIDFIEFWGVPELHVHAMKILLMIVVLQSLNLLAFMWFNRSAGIRILALRQQLNVYKRKSKKPQLRNRAVLSLVLKDLEKLDI